MAFRLIGEQINKENDGHLGVYSQKCPNSARQYSVKKQAFNELKNVMHNNQPFATPLKHGDIQRLGKQSHSILRDQELKQIKSKQSITAEASSCNWDNLALLDCFDYNRPCCTEPYKSDAEVWGEIDIFDDLFLNEIIDEHLSVLSDDEESIADSINLCNDDCSDDIIVNDLSSTFMQLLAKEDTFVDISYEEPTLLEDFDDIF